MKSIPITDYSLSSYEAFLAAKRAPIHWIGGNTIHIEDFEYNDADLHIDLAPHLWDYQQFGRIHRYGQKDQVLVYIPHTDLEKPMLENVMRKQSDYVEDAGFQERLYVEGCNGTANSPASN